MDCVESEWTEIKLFQRFFPMIRTTDANLFSNCPAKQAGNSSRISQVVTRVRLTANLGQLVETILADLKFVPRSKKPSSGCLRAKLYLLQTTISLPSSFQHSFQTFINRLRIMVIIVTLEIYAGLSRHLHFPSSIRGSILLAGSCPSIKSSCGSKNPFGALPKYIRDISGERSST